MKFGSSERFSSCLVALLLLAQTGPVSGQTPVSRKSSLEGYVLRADTSEPIAGAQFILTPVPTFDGTPPPSSGYRPSISDPNAVLSDGDGRFVLSDIEPGFYFLGVFSDGFAMQCFGTKHPGRNGCSGSTVLKLEAEKRTGNIVIRMTRGGVITGRITDPSGQPLSGMPVDLRRNGYDASGQKSYLTGPIGTVVTNDRGEYRMYGIDPGRYYIDVRPSPIGAILAVQPGALRVTDVATESSEALASMYGVTFYPGVTEIVRDSLIEIQAGSELNGMDFSAQRLPSLKYRIRGRIVDSRPGQSPQRFGYSILPNKDGMSVGTRIYYSAANGTFESLPLVPGSYRVQAQISSPVARPQPGEPPPVFPTLYASTSVEIVAADLEGVTVTFAPPVSISGRLRIEGQETPILPLLEKVRVRLKSAVGNSPQAAPIGTDGTFSIENASVGSEYAVTLTGLPSDMYVNEARLGDVDLLSEPLKLFGSSRDSLNITIGVNGGRVEGVVRDGQKTPAPYTQVVLIPDEHRERRDLFKTVTSDVAGRYSFRGIPPGNYKIFAWEDLEPYSYFDNDFVNQSVNFAAVQIWESEAVSPELMMNPAPKK